MTSCGTTPGVGILKDETGEAERIWAWCEEETSEFA